MNSKRHTVMKKYIFTVMAVAAMLASCTKESTADVQPEIDTKETNGIATIGVLTDDATKVVVSAEDNTQVLWEAGDKISVYGAEDNPFSTITLSVPFTLKNGAGTTSGTFEMDGDQQLDGIKLIYSVVYPQDAFDKFTGKFARKDTLHCKIPTVQKARKGSFDKAAAVMYDLPDSPYDGDNVDNILLKYAVNFLKLTVSGSDQVSKIKIGSSVALTGKVAISKDGKIEAEENETENYVILESENGQALEAGDYYIAVRPCRIENPVISYIYEDSANGKISIKRKKGNGAITFAEGKNVKPVSFNSASVAAHEAVQLWENGPYWATCNIGASTEEDRGHYFQWGSVWGFTFYMSAKLPEQKWKAHPDMYPNTPLQMAVGSMLEGFISGFTPEFYEQKVGGYSITSDLGLNRDIAHIYWGEGWRIPTRSDFENLVSSSKTTLTYTTLNNVAGMLVEGKGAYSGRFIFFPAAGQAENTRITAIDSYVFYWTRTHKDDDSSHIMKANSVGTVTQGSLHRYFGLPIRPVLYL